MKPVAAIAALAAALLLAARGKAPPPKAEEIRPVKVMKVGASSATRAVEYAGEVRPRHETRLSFRVGGKIVERMVEVGTRVRPGQPVARLDHTDLSLAADSAKAQMASLEAAEHDRRLSTFTTADAKLGAVRAQYRQAANQAAYATLATDTAGVITAIEAEAGQVVTAGQTVARLARPGEKEIAIAIPESQRDLIEGAKELTVTLNAVPGRVWKGRLRELSPAADPASRTYAARIKVLAADEAMDLGMSARVGVPAAQPIAGVELPVAALYSRGDSPNVWVVGAGGAVRLVRECRDRIRPERRRPGGDCRRQSHPRGTEGPRSR